jgi:hypothetical protein
VSIDEILEALCALDREGETPRTPSGLPRHRRPKPDPARDSVEFDIDGARIRAHRNNIARYRKLLRTHLTPLERVFIERRVREEQRSLGALVARSSSAAPMSPRQVTQDAQLEHQQ